MGRARSERLTPGKIETHHTWSRCVQRATLCGKDPLTGCDFSYRRLVLRDLVRYQAGVFAVDVGNYSVLGNHFHLIVRSRPDLVTDWSDAECAWRYRMAWPSLHDGVWGREPTDEQVEEVVNNPRRLAAARKYLSSISGFLARVKEPLAKCFNAEMETKGHFWEARFGNRRLKSREEVIGCSLYVDLNHVKAGAANSLLESTTSAIQDRLITEQFRETWAKANSEASLEAFAESELPLPDQSLLEDFFRDGWLAPITDDAPLATQERIEVPTEDESHELQGAGEGESTQAADAAVLHESSERNQTKEGRPKRSRSHKWHRRYRTRLKRRKSNRCFIDSAWSAYRRTAEQLAANLVSARAKQKKHSPLPLWRETASTFGRDVSRFLQSLADVIEGLRRVGGSTEPALDAPGQPTLRPKAPG